MFLQKCKVLATAINERNHSNKSTDILIISVKFSWIMKLINDICIIQSSIICAVFWISWNKLKVSLGMFIIILMSHICWTPNTFSVTWRGQTWIQSENEILDIFLKIFFYLNWSKVGGALGANGDCSGSGVSYDGSGGTVPPSGGGSNVGIYCLRGMVPMIIGTLTIKSNAGPDGSTLKLSMYWTSMMLQFPEHSLFNWNVPAMSLFNIYLPDWWEELQALLLLLRPSSHFLLHLFHLFQSLSQFL